MSLSRVAAVIGTLQPIRSAIRAYGTRQPGRDAIISHYYYENVICVISPFT